MPRPSLGRKRVQITLPPEMLAEIRDVFGSSTRSVVVELALRQLIDRALGRGRRRKVQGEFDARGEGDGTPTHGSTGDTQI